MRKLILLIFLIGCVHIPNTRVCTIPDKMAQGAICAETLTDKTSEMTLDEWISFLEPTKDHAGAMCQSSDDWNKQKTALEESCRSLGNNCSYETKLALERMKQWPLKKR